MLLIEERVDENALMESRLKRQELHFRIISQTLREKTGHTLFGVNSAEFISQPET